MAATQPTYKSDELNLAQLVGETLNLAKGNGLLLDADVGAGKTYLTMQAAVVTNASTKNTEFQGYIDRFKRAFDYGKALGILSDANVQGVSTVAELVAITPADSNKFGPTFLE